MDALTKLRNIQDKDFMNKEEFLNILKLSILDDQSGTHKPVILKYTVRDEF